MCGSVLPAHMNAHHICGSQRRAVDPRSLSYILFESRHGNPNLGPPQKLLSAVKDQTVPLAFQFTVLNWKDTVIMTKRIRSSQSGPKVAKQAVNQKGRRLTDWGALKKARLLDCWSMAGGGTVTSWEHIYLTKSNFSYWTFNPIKVFLATVSQALDIKMGQKTALILRGQRNYSTLLAIYLIFSTRPRVLLVQALLGVEAGHSVQSSVTHSSSGLRGHACFSTKLKEWKPTIFSTL